MTMVKQYTQMCVRSALLISPRLFPIVTHKISKQSNKAHFRVALSLTF